VESTKVWFQPLDENLIEAYISSGDPMDKAGAYGIQSFGGILVKRIEGCFYNVMGLPVSRLYHRLRSETELLDSLAVS
jgi:septum formation protein